MYIKSIVLDGFKSYGNRVEVTGFDREFNAITGLNGTGKSNILDSICFVLGITNLSNVRAGSLQELIYKHGQAGITKATVSITFDNRDKKQCPIGYEDHDEITVTRQVVMGGKNRYMINGINVQNKRVSDLFCSVQLNVNNPHFLIMQGRITKVLNMKPPEILSMVEEAAGTRMYEAKKQAAQKTIEKKDAKLRELNEIINEDITPKLNKLQDERSHYQEFQKVNREVDSLEKLYVAYKYACSEKEIKKIEDKSKKIEDEIKDKKTIIKNNKKESAAIDEKIAELNRKLDEESGSVVKQLESSLQAAEKEEATAHAALSAARDALASHRQRHSLLRRARADDTAAHTAKQGALDQVAAAFDSLRSASAAAEADLAAAQARFLAVSSGLEGDSHSLQDRLIAAKQAASEAATRISQSEMERRHAEDRLRKLEREFASSSAQYERDRDAIGRQEAALDAIRAELADARHDEAALRALQERARALHAAAARRRDRRDELAARLQRCDFQYSPPERGFDAARVLGTVARLVDVRDPAHCTALETAAGGKLYNVVVDTETTSKLLLQRGNLRQRTTIIPLNKISGQVIDRQTLEAAREVGGGPDAVMLALDLVSFPERVRPAMRWVFGGTLVCRDLETARRVTFHPRVRRRCVTLDGDVFDPAGTLTGGARARGAGQLLQLRELRGLERDLAAADAELAEVTRELQAATRAGDVHAALQQRRDEAAHELEVGRARLATTSPARLHAEIEALRARVADLAAGLERDEAARAETAARAADLEDKMRDIKGHREREYRRAEEELRAAKRSAERHTALWRERERELQTLQMEVEELGRAVAAGDAQLADAAAAEERLRAAHDAADAEHRAAAEAARELHARLKRQRAEMASRSGEVGALARTKEKLAETEAELRLGIEELQLALSELEAEAAERRGALERLGAAHAWLAAERAGFGVAGGAYDFCALGASSAGARLGGLRARRDKLQRGLNTRAHHLLEKEERQYNELLAKKTIVEADRAKLVQVMAELDEKKRRTLLAAAAQVNRDFASIFATLLPGAMARLAPPPGRSVLDGLEVKVGFNGAWKESLGELSGGQRSLVALSLVLAMLVFKPAPLYILDEVDAALDLSHTQNIGIMLKEHFKHSQFIIVSLKDGMFNNANVLFRTRFVDGMSSVQRTVNVRR